MLPGSLLGSSVRVDASDLPSRTRQKGFSLVEVALATTLLLLLMGGLYLLVVKGLHSLADARAYSDSRQESLKGMHLLAWELANSTRDGVYPSGNAVWFLSAQAPVPGSSPVAFDAAGNLYWKKWVCYYLDAAGDLVRSELALSSPVTVPLPVPTPSPSLSAFQSVTGPGKRVVARGIKDFQVTQVSGTVYSIKVVGEQYTGSDKPTQVELVTEVKVRNQ